MLTLRPYQSDAVTAVLRHFETHGRNTNPLVSIPTGGGKSLVIAATIKAVCDKYGDQDFLVLTHNKELIRQNSEELRKYWPEVRQSVYCAGLGRRETKGRVKFASIQSVYAKSNIFQNVRAIIVDEAHLVSTAQDTMYRKLFADMNVPVIGYTATPYRMTTGLLHEGPGALFTHLVHETGMLELMNQGYLCRLNSLVSAQSANMSGVKMSGGEFVMGSAADAFRGKVGAMCRDFAVKTEGRTKSLVFCTTIEHAEEAAYKLPNAEAIHSRMTRDERDERLQRFRRGQLRTLCNVDVLTTGFNAPGIDAIAFMRPTASPGLYVQMAGRGTRNAPGKTDCLVADYAGNIARLGPVVAPYINTCKAQRRGPAVGMESALLNLACTECEAYTLTEDGKPDSCWSCGSPLMKPERGMGGLTESLSDTPAQLDIMGEDCTRFTVEASSWVLHNKYGRPQSLRVVYAAASPDGRRSDMFDYICPEHGGGAARRAAAWAKQHGIAPAGTAAELKSQEALARQPSMVYASRAGDWWKIKRLIFQEKKDQ